MARALARDGLPASRLVLEVTESTALAADAETQAALAALREFGVALAVHDFGTGYSSLTYLARLQVDLLSSTARSSPGSTSRRPRPASSAR